MDISISVLIPVYKTQDYLPVALQSLVDQTVAPSEVLIVDDGPDPAVDTIVARWTDRLNIKVVKHAENLGTLQARKTAAEHCQTDYSIFLDPDDTLHPEALSRLADCAAQTQADVICFGIKRFGVEGEVTLVLEPQSQEVVTFDKMDVLRNQFTSAGPEYKYAGLSTGGGKLIRTETLKAAVNTLGEVPHIIYSDDSLLMFLVLCEARTICQLPLDLYEYRKRETSITYVVGLNAALRYLNDSNWAMDRMEDYARRHLDADIGIIKMLFHNRRYIKITAILERLGKTHWNDQELKALYETLPEVLRDALYTTELELQMRGLKKQKFRLQNQLLKSERSYRSLKTRSLQLEDALSNAKIKPET